MNAIDLSLNAAVISMACECFPNGFDIGPDAPDTLEKLVAYINQHKGRLKVFDGASDKTIFGDAHINHCFRAWHDFVHYLFKLPFTPEGEARVCAIQCDMLAQRYGETDLVAHWRALLNAEINGQLRYASRHNGQFPIDQNAFALAYLQDAEKAICADY